MLWDTYWLNRIIAKNNVYRNLINKLIHDVRASKRLFVYILSETISNVSIPAIEGDASEIVYDYGHVADMLENQFSQAHIRDSGNNLPTLPSDARVNNTKEDWKITEEIVQEQLSALSSQSSPDPDGIHPHFIKQCAVTLAKPIENIINASLDKGSLIHYWKHASVT